ncbi:hypothetical protein SAMN02799630_00208 [Paenibacillus sp. UNCCL117]|uniref:hypothetical protein n=1 Tax=unclassified Paenibacillus TaxID=185978 RepID=UPI00088A32FB|nr:MULTISPECIES: hypothetical protein [unclassified Paenibacillus]SDC48429.1 hypothetical protein SAMN04488602_102324 [Paenibacillus sp. cl123]SFW11935.1 hypothetical protein SAMN02799630_00208 [Paenibacillus sp. UNCCL117]
MKITLDIRQLADQLKGPYAEALHAWQQQSDMKSAPSKRQHAGETKTINSVRQHVLAK